MLSKGQPSLPILHAYISHTKLFILNLPINCMFVKYFIFLVLFFNHYFVCKLFIPTLQLYIFFEGQTFSPKLFKKNAISIPFLSTLSILGSKQIHLYHWPTFRSLGSRVALLRAGVSFQTWGIVIVWHAIFLGSRQTSVTVVISQKTL